MADEANLGLATTRELLTELSVRFEISTPYKYGRKLIGKMVDNLSQEEMDYRTVDNG